MGKRNRSRPTATPTPSGTPGREEPWLLDHSLDLADRFDPDVRPGVAGSGRHTRALGEPHRTREYDDELGNGARNTKKPWARAVLADRDCAKRHALEDEPEPDHSDPHPLVSLLLESPEHLPARFSVASGPGQSAPSDWDSVSVASSAESWHGDPPARVSTQLELMCCARSIDPLSTPTEDDAEGVFEPFFSRRGHHHAVGCPLVSARARSKAQAHAGPQDVGVSRDQARRLAFTARRLVERFLGASSAPLEAGLAPLVAVLRDRSPQLQSAVCSHVPYPAYPALKAAVAGSPSLVRAALEAEADAMAVFRVYRSAGSLCCTRKAEAKEGPSAPPAPAPSLLRASTPAVLEAAQLYATEAAASPSKGSAPGPRRRPRRRLTLEQRRAKDWRKKQNRRIRALAHSAEPAPAAPPSQSFGELVRSWPAPLFSVFDAKGRAAPELVASPLSNPLLESLAVPPALTPFSQGLARWGESSIVSTVQRFRLNLSAFSGGALDAVDWASTAVSGGAVLACLLPLPAELEQLHSDYQAALSREAMSTVAAAFSSSGLSPAAVLALRRRASVPPSGSAAGPSAKEARVQLLNALSAYYHSDDNPFWFSDLRLHLLPLPASAAPTTVEERVDGLYTRILPRLPDHSITHCGSEIVLTCAFPHRRIHISCTERSVEALVLEPLMDCAAVCYSDGKVLADRRFVHAVNTGFNLLPPSALSGASRHAVERVLKYAQRGFGTALHSSCLRSPRCDSKAGADFATRCLFRDMRDHVRRSVCLRSMSLAASGYSLETWSYCREHWYWSPSALLVPEEAATHAPRSPIHGPPASTPGLGPAPAVPSGATHLHGPHAEFALDHPFTLPAMLSPYGASAACPSVISDETISESLLEGESCSPARASPASTARSPPVGPVSRGSKQAVQAVQTVLAPPPKPLTRTFLEVLKASLPPPPPTPAPEPLMDAEDAAALVMGWMFAS